MPSHTIVFNVPTPVLQTGEHFRIRYRLQGATTWVSATNMTNNGPYSLIVPSAGTWEVSITLVKADSSLCDEIIYTVPVIEPDCTCLTGVTAIIESPVLGQWQLKISFTLPVVFPACGITFSTTDAGTTITRTFSTAASLISPLIIPITTSNGRNVIITQDCCGKNVQQCANIDVSGGISRCISSTWPSMENQRLVFFQSGQWYLRILRGTDSNPSSPTYSITYIQDAAPGAPHDSGTVVFANTGAIYQWPIAPIGSTPYTYSVTVVDSCGVKVVVG